MIINASLFKHLGAGFAGIIIILMVNQLLIQCTGEINALVINTYALGAPR